MESTTYKQIALLPPNPQTRRGFRVNWSINHQETLLAYPCQNNVVIRDVRNPQKAYVYTDYMSKVTCVKFSPNGQYIASGDASGKVRIFSFNESTNEIIVKKEHNMLAGAVYSIVFTDDGQRIIAAGEGKDMFAKAVLADSGTKIGDIFGPSKTVTTIDVKPKPYRLVIGGENQELNVYDGVPFKAVKSIPSHTNFVNKVAFCPLDGGKKFLSVSSDKSIIVYDSDSTEVLQKIEKAHNKGIIDAAWIDEDMIMTASTDNTLKIWNAQDGSEIKCLQISEDGTEKVDNQQLGLIAESEAFWSVTLNSNINIYEGKDVFKKDQITPSRVVLGHSNNITAICMVGTTLISADQDGKLLSWSPFHISELVKSDTLPQHTSVVAHLVTQDQDSFYSASTDGTLYKSFRVVDTHSFEFRQSLKLEGSPIDMKIGSDDQVFVLLSNQKLQVISSDFSQSRTHEFKDCDPTCITTYDNQVWVGDKKAVIRILSADDFSQISQIEKKLNQQISVMRTSHNQQIIAVGDSHRNFVLFNSATGEEISKFGYHTARITGLDFNSDDTQLLTSSLDLGVAVLNIQEGTKKLLHRTNEKELTAAIFDSENGRFFTSGYDCAIRQWSL